MHTKLRHQSPAYASKPDGTSFGTARFTWLSLSADDASLFHRVVPIHHRGCREFPAPVIHFIDLFCLRSILLEVGPTKKVTAIELPEIGLSKIISDQIGSENPRSHSRCTYGAHDGRMHTLRTICIAKLRPSTASRRSDQGSGPHDSGHNTVGRGEISRFVRLIRQKDETMPGRRQIGAVDRLQRARM